MKIVFVKASGQQFTFELTDAEIEELWQLIVKLQEKYFGEEYVEVRLK